MIDGIINIANGAAMVGNLLIGIVTAYGYFKFGRRRFLLLFLIATPIFVLMTLLNATACMGKDVVHIVFPGRTFAVASLLCNCLYPVAIIFSLAGTVLMVGYVKEKEQKESEPGVGR